MPAGGFAVRTRAASGHHLAGKRTGLRGVRWTGQARGGQNARPNRVPGNVVLELSQRWLRLRRRVPRRSADRRARPDWRAAAPGHGQAATFVGAARTMVGMRLSALRLPLCCRGRAFKEWRGGWQNSGAECVAGTHSLIRPRGAKRSGGGGPREAWWRGRAAMGRISSVEASLAADAPSTALRAVPLPRFAGQDKKAVMRAPKKTIGNARRLRRALSPPEPQLWSRLRTRAGEACVSASTSDRTLCS